jgi:hypothetical protein
MLPVPEVQSPDAIAHFADCFKRFRHGLGDVMVPRFNETDLRTARENSIHMMS